MSEEHRKAVEVPTGVSLRWHHGVFLYLQDTGEYRSHFSLAVALAEQVASYHVSFLAC